jgi:hypothetical protein
MKIYKIIIAVLLVLLALALILPFVFGQVFLEEDQAMICLSAVWTNTCNDVVCKVYNQDDVKDMHSIYSDMMQEKDTFDLELK